MKQLLFCLLIFCFSGHSSAQTIRVGLFSDKSVKEYEAFLGKGSYFLFADSVFQLSLPAAKSLRFSIVGAKVKVTLQGQYLCESSKIRLVQGLQEDFLFWTCISPVSKQRAYEGDFTLEIRKGALLLINQLDIETYLEGVVESEGGTGQRLNYYKAQAIISRTYALSHFDKHQEAGYNLCDRVHCQAYLHKRNDKSSIDTAVFQTRTLVMVDSNNAFYPTYFHANCGGQTCEPHYIWNEEIPGLKTFKDTFCIHTQQANWQKRIPLQTWTDYLVKKYDFPLSDSLSYAQLRLFEQPQRMAFYLQPVYGIPLRDLREHFQLKSTFFSAEIVGNEMVLIGKGYGHGVGLCQEGAIQMAKLGYQYDQILRYYYPGMRLISLPELQKGY
ncbi:MAG: hypothetical protein RLZZ301_1377 [Bacteroidota bacterium]|jgi:stage II sporulation protein D